MKTQEMETIFLSQEREISMLTFEIMRLKGISGAIYPFRVYVLDSELRSIEAVFVISSRICQSDGRERHKFLYVGQTDNLAESLSNFQKLPWIQQNNANSLFVLAEDDEGKRTEIVKDIQKKYDLERIP